MAKRQSINLKEYRKQLRQLQRAGLVSNRVDVKHHKPTAYMRKQLREYRAVLDGEAKVLKTNTRSTAKQIEREYGQVRRKGNAIIVPVQKNTKKVSYDLKSRKIKVRRQVRGREKTTELVPRTPDGKPRKIPRLKKGQLYLVKFAQRGGVSFDSWPKLAAFMKRYESSEGGTWDNWIDYVEIIDT